MIRYSDQALYLSFLTIFIFRRNFRQNANLASGRPSRQVAHQNQSNSNGVSDDEPRSRIRRDENSGEIVEYRHENGESYKVDEASYIQTQRSDVPYLITKISVTGDQKLIFRGDKSEIVNFTMKISVF